MRVLFGNKLKKKYNVFHVRKHYDGGNDAHIKERWEQALGKERILPVTNPKAVIDVILGAIAITSGSRNLQTYVADMVERGQTKERIDEVSSALKLYNSMFSPKKLLDLSNGKKRKKKRKYHIHNAIIKFRINLNSKKN